MKLQIVGIVDEGLSEEQILALSVLSPEMFHQGPNTTIK